LNDRHRVTRQGRGTFDRVLRGMRLLRDYEIPFDVITVLTSTSLDYPDELFDFYMEHGLTSVAFNVEEIEGPHVTSSLSGSGVESRFRRFYSRFMDLALAADPPLRVREFDSAHNSVSYRQPEMRTRSAGPSPSSTWTTRATFRDLFARTAGPQHPRHGSFALQRGRDSLNPCSRCRGSLP
jgi:uncharacterized protein